MTFLDRLKTKLADAPQHGAEDPGRAFVRYAHASEGFEGARSRGVNGNGGACGGFEGSPGGHISRPGELKYAYKASENPSLELLKSSLEKQVHAQARGQTPIPEAPSKLPKGADILLGGRITSGHVRAAIERELHALAQDGMIGPEAERRAVAITAGKIRNSESMAPEQPDSRRCPVCEDVLDADGVIAILTGKPDRVLYLHAACHDEHSRRLTAFVDQIMAEAGFSPDRSGEAA